MHLLRSENQTQTVACHALPHTPGEAHTDGCAPHLCQVHLCQRAERARQLRAQLALILAAALRSTHLTSRDIAWVFKLNTNSSHGLQGVGVRVTLLPCGTQDQSGAHRACAWSTSKVLPSKRA